MASWCNRWCRGRGAADGHGTRCELRAGHRLRRRRHQAELLSDVAVRITPLTDLDAAEMLRRCAASRCSTGYRGSPERCRRHRDVLLRISAMVDAHPEIAELDANPVIVV